MQECSGGEALAESADELVGEALFVRADCCGVPFGAFHVIDGDKGGFATHSESDIAGGKSAIDFVSELINTFPLGI